MRLHLGSGPVRLAGWVNVDLDNPEADVHHDLRRPMLCASASVDAIFCEHFIEHISRDSEVGRFLRECWRVLKPGGVIRVTTPDLRWLIARYEAQAIDDWRDVGWSPASPCHLLNEAMRSWGHQWVYDADDLRAVFGEAGSVDCRYMPWRESTTPGMGALEHRPYHHELIMEATKGAAPTTPHRADRAPPMPLWRRGRRLIGRVLWRAGLLK